MTDSEDYRERELKFDIAPDWQLPDPSGLVPAGGSLQRDTAHIETTYFDTAGRDLLRSRLTLRRRTGDSDAGWQLKMPAGDARTEIRLPLDGRTVPAEMRRATHGVRAGAALHPLATLRTEREIHRLLDGDGTPLAEIVLDTVSSLEVREVGVTRRWREVEVELLKGDERLLGRVARWLVKRGATRSSSGSKLARAVGSESGESRDSATLAGLIGSYLDAQTDAIVRGDIELRRGGDAVHATRVGTRRYRSVLRELSGLFDAERASALSGELGWLAAELGALRDAQVLRAHLDDMLAELPAELVVGPIAARIHATLSAEEDAASARLAAAMRTRRYFALLTELRQWREHLPVATDAPAQDVAGYLAKGERRVRRRVKKAPSGAGRDEALHRARKAAKRGRYLAELAGPALGKHARRVEKRMKKTQDRLGARQDRIIAAQFLRRAAADASAAGEDGFTYGLLHERALARAAAVRG